MNNTKLHIVMYHYVRDLAHSRYPNIKALDYSLFRTQIEYLKSKFTFISAEELSAAVNGGDNLPQNSVLLTFDDGYIDHYTNVFPLLKNNRIPAFFSMPGMIIAENKLLDINKIHFILASSDTPIIKDRIFDLLNYYRGKEFVIPDNQNLYAEYAVASRFDDPDVVFIKRVLQTALDENLRNKIASQLFREFVSCSEETFSKELYMSYDQVKLMKDSNMCFGLHGYDHYWLGNLPKDQMENDIDKALDVFSSILPKKDWIMCYPFGSYNPDTIEYIKSKGCGIGFTTKTAIADLKNDSPFELPRFDTNDFPPKSERYIKTTQEQKNESF